MKRKAKMKMVKLLPRLGFHIQIPLVVSLVECHDLVMDAACFLSFLSLIIYLSFFFFFKGFFWCKT